MPDPGTLGWYCPHKSNVLPLEVPGHMSWCGFFEFSLMPFFISCFKTMKSESLFSVFLLALALETKSSCHQTDCTAKWCTCPQLVAIYYFLFIYFYRVPTIGGGGWNPLWHSCILAETFELFSPKIIRPKWMCPPLAHQMLKIWFTAVIRGITQWSVWAFIPIEAFWLILFI